MAKITYLSASKPSGAPNSLRTTKKKSRLTPEKAADLELLRAFWRRRIKELKFLYGIKLTYGTIAQRWGISQNAVTQKMSGKMPLNERWMMILSIEMLVKPQDVWPDWPYSVLTHERCPPDMLNLLPVWRKLSAADRRKLEKEARACLRRPETRTK